MKPSRERYGICVDCPHFIDLADGTMGCPAFGAWRGRMLECTVRTRGAAKPPPETATGYAVKREGGWLYHDGWREYLGPLAMAHIAPRQWLAEAWAKGGGEVYEITLTARKVNQPENPES